MKYFEFGKENADLMDMLHGGSVCYRGGSTGGLAGEHPEEFSKEVQAVHRHISEKNTGTPQTS